MPDELKKENENINEDEDFEADQNLLGFFKLLLEVDMRVNPHLYTKPKEKETNNPKPNA
ncbi:MAG: hypothetical protein AAB361_00595 [Patescibacteria group bacterium]